MKVHKRNVILWGTQATIDRTYAMPDDFEKVLQRIVKEKILPYLKERFRQLSQEGLPSDVNIKLDDAARYPGVPGQFGRLKQFLKQEGFDEHTQIGGNPLISALYGHLLTVGRGSLRLPATRYVGILADTVRDYLNQQIAAGESYWNEVVNRRHCIEVHESPETIALEQRNKLILAYGPGRDLSFISKGGDFGKYLDRMEKAAACVSGGKVVIALSIPHPIDATPAKNLGTRLLDQIRSRFKERAVIFIGTSSFRGEGGIRPSTGLIYDTILKKADVVSMNETELHDLHTTVVGDGARRDITLADKLRQLDLRAIKICHSSDGAILELGCQPDKVITSPDFFVAPDRYLQETLQLAVDGAAYALESNFGRGANETMVRIYSASSMTSRPKDLFNTTYLKTLERLPGGIVAAQAPLVANRLGSATGLGALFDGIFLSFLMRH